MVIQIRKARARFSRLRQDLGWMARQISKLLDPIMSDKPLIKGTVYELKRRCGKPTCRCLKGQLHSTMVLIASEGGHKKLRVIPKGYLVEIRIKATRYRQVRAARAEFIQLTKRIVALMDEIEELRREEMKKDGSGRLRKGSGVRDRKTQGGGVRLHRQRR